MIRYENFKVQVSKLTVPKLLKRRLYTAALFFRLAARPALMSRAARAVESKAVDACDSGRIPNSAFQWC
jgi:hypothetical protein